MALTDKTIPNTFARIAAMITVIANGLAQVATIRKQKFAKGGIIGGSLHSQGGTTFTGSDGSRFEAERGELLAIVNRHDTARLQALSDANKVHGKAFFADGGTFTPKAQANGDSVILQEMRQQIIDQRVYVVEQDITSTQKRVQVVDSRGDF